MNDRNPLSDRLKRPPSDYMTDAKPPYWMTKQRIWDRLKASEAENAVHRALAEEQRLKACKS